MNLSNKILAGTAIGAGVWAIATYINSMNRVQAQLQVVPNVMIHQLSLEGLTIRVDALLKNPTRASFKIKYPFIEIINKDVLVGSSDVINKDIKIPPFGQVLVQGMLVKIPVMSFFSVVYDMIKALLNKQAITLTVAVVTTIDLGWTQVAYDNKKDIVLQKSK